LVDAIISKLFADLTLSSLSSIVKVLAESPKTRLCSWLKNACGRQDVTSDLGPYARIRDIFTRQPRELLSLSIGKNESLLSEWVRRPSGSPSVTPLRLFLFRQVYTAANVKRPEWIFAMILLLIRSPGALPEIADFSPQVEHWPLQLEGELRDIVLDVHTGKRKRGDPEALLDFAVRGAHVENEAVLHPCHVALKEFYVECKKPGAQCGVYPLGPATSAAAFNYKDTDMFVPTGELIGFKTPTFFATMIGSEAKVFVKLVKAGDAEFAIR
jgi:hypothetical protein